MQVLAIPLIKKGDVITAEYLNRLASIYNQQTLLPGSFANGAMRVQHPTISGAAPTVAGTYYARAYTAITPATGPLAAQWGGGQVKFQDPITGELDVDPTDVDNPLIGVAFVADAQVQLEKITDPPQVKNGTCGAVSWA